MRIWVLALVLLALAGFADPGHSQNRMTGTLGQPCFDDGSCVFGLACNEAGLCENCGGHGELACEGDYCDEGYRGVVPVGRGTIRYCSYVADDFTYRQNCGSVGFFMCPDTNECWGAAVPLGGTRLCVACGLLGQRCCDRNDCREPLSDAVCWAGRCVPPQSQSQSGSSNGSGSLFGDENAADRGLNFDDFLEEQALDNQVIDPTPAPPVNLPNVLRPFAGLGLVECGCFSTDGRNGTCANNGCIEPENFSGECQWWCNDANGQSFGFRGRDGARLN